MIRRLVNVVAIAVMATANVSIAQVINVDIQGTQYGNVAPGIADYTGASANGPIVSGTTWNYFNVGGTVPNGQSLLNLNDDSGATTTVDVAFGTGWLGSFADGAPNNLQGDRTFINTGVTGTFTISGLDISKDYNLALITGVSSGFGTDFTAGGTTKTATAVAGAGANANGPLLTFTNGVSHVLFSGLDGSTGSITFSVTDSAVGVNGVLAGLQIEVAGADLDDPVITTLDPANGATVGVALDANLVVTFDESVAFGTGDITLRTSGGGLVEAFDVTSSPNLSLAGTTVTIDPTNNLVGGNSYYVEIAATAIDDLSGNSFAGISGSTTWSFSPDTTAPSIDTLVPANGAPDASYLSSLVITFDENVQKGTGNIVIRQVSGGTVVDTIDVISGNVTVSGAQVTITSGAGLPQLTSLYVEIDATAIDDLAGNSFAGISGSGTWSFTTAGIVRFHDFNTDPGLSTGWDAYKYYLKNSPDTLTEYATWSGSDLSFTSPDSGATPATDWAEGISLVEATRTPTEPVTLTVKALAGTSGSWGFVGLMISVVAEASYVVSGDDTYSLVLIPESATHFHYEVRKAYLDGTAPSYVDFVLTNGPSTEFTGPYVIDIVRNGDGNYEFLADGDLLYTSGDVAADTYDASVKDSMVYYQILFGAQRAQTATVDDFGVPYVAPPQPSRTLFIIR
ncbi:MAG: Ig-like domain-containing protein [Verrucomicrobia bacterium]|nr:Ig-like domain-containing protein [Verrucomicrobiota bacterium]